MISVEKVIVLPRADGTSAVEVTFVGRDGNAVVSQFVGTVHTSLTARDGSYLHVEFAVSDGTFSVQPELVDPAPEVA